jgi:hypothetical protein
MGDSRNAVWHSRQGGAPFFACGAFDFHVVLRNIFLSAVDEAATICVEHASIYAGICTICSTNDSGFELDGIAGAVEIHDDYDAYNAYDAQ